MRGSTTLPHNSTPTGKEELCMFINNRPSRNWYAISRVKEVQATASGDNLQARCMKCRRETPVLAKQCIEAKKCLK